VTDIMTGGYEEKAVESSQHFANYIPIPYGCLTLAALILGALTTVVLSSLAIGIAILR